MKTKEQIIEDIAMDHCAWVISLPEPIGIIELIVHPDYWKTAKKDIIKRYGGVTRVGSDDLSLIFGDRHINVMEQTLDDWIIGLKKEFIYTNPRRDVTLKTII